MRNRIFICAALLLVAANATPQQQGTIEYTPQQCILGGELPMLMVSTVDDGLLRAYFRRLGTVDWCSVDGKNLGKASNVILPRFEIGTDIEYYFVILKGKEVIAKSPQIYRTRAMEKCDAPFARHAINLTMECLPPGQNPVATAMNAGYHTTSTTEDKTPRQSPEKPERERRGGQ
jgi:hypothetical protein